MRRDTLRSYSHVEELRSNSSHELRSCVPHYVSPLDCSADSAMTSHRPKCSAGTTPRISYRENARLLPQFFSRSRNVRRCPSAALFFHARRACTDEKSNHGKPNHSKVKPLQSQTDERRFVPIYTTAGPRGRQQPTPESFYYSAEKRLNITRRRMLDALLGSGCLKYYLSAKAQRIVRQRMPKVLLIGES